MAFVVDNGPFSSTGCRCIRLISVQPQGFTPILFRQGWLRVLAELPAVDVPILFNILKGAKLQGAAMMAAGANGMITAAIAIKIILEARMALDWEYGLSLSEDQ